MDAWWAKNDRGSAKGASWATPNMDVSAWKTMALPHNWESAVTELKDFDGILWFRRDVQVPADWAGKDLWLELGPIDDQDTTFFNGVAVGENDNWMAPRGYKVPGKLVKAGKAVITVRVLDTGGGAVDGFDRAQAARDEHGQARGRGGLVQAEKGVIDRVEQVAGRVAVRLDQRGLGRAVRLVTVGSHRGKPWRFQAHPRLDFTVVKVHDHQLVCTRAGDDGTAPTGHEYHIVSTGTDVH